MSRTKIALLSVTILGALGLSGCNEPQLGVDGLHRNEGGTLTISGKASDDDGSTLLTLSVGDEIMGTRTVDDDDYLFSFTFPEPADDATKICLWLPNVRTSSADSDQDIVKCMTRADATNAPKPSTTTTSTTSTTTTSTTSTTTTTSSTTTSTIPDEGPGDCDFDNPCDPEEGI